MNNIEERFMTIESAVAHSQRMIDEINEVVIEQAKKIDALIKHNMEIIAMFNQNEIRPLSEETPPPHY